VGTAKILSGTLKAYYMDGATQPFYLSGSATPATITELTATVPSYGTATLTFDTSSSTTAADTPLTDPTNLTTVPITATSTNGTSITDYGLNIAYLPSGTRNVKLIVSAAKYYNSGTQTTATGLPKACLFSTKTVSLGAAYELNFNLTQGNGTVINLYWAKGNLKYNKDASGVETWSFYGTQFGHDANKSVDYFEWNTLVPDPNGDSTNPNGDWKPADDPCSKVSSTRAWRTPTRGEFNVLKAMYTATPSQSSWDATNRGRWFGDTQNTGNTSVYLFLPAAGYSGGNVDRTGLYWSTMPTSNFAWYLGFGSGSLTVNDGGVRDYGFSVRCVSDPPKSTNSVEANPNVVDESNGTLTQTN
jgi:uncharacterized protein (TIGR02145 family)